MPSWNESDYARMGMLPPAKVFLAPLGGDDDEPAVSGRWLKPYDLEVLRVPNRGALIATPNGLALFTDADIRPTLREEHAVERSDAQIRPWGITQRLQVREDRD